MTEVVEKKISFELFQSKLKHAVKVKNVKTKFTSMKQISRRTLYKKLCSCTYFHFYISILYYTKISSNKYLLEIKLEEQQINSNVPVNLAVNLRKTMPLT